MRFAVPIRLALFASLVCAVAWGATFGRVTPLVGGAADIVLDEPRSRVYLSGSNTSQLQIFSIAQQRFLAPITVDALPLGIALARSGKFLYIACYNASSLNVVDLDALAVTSRISLPAKPEAVAVGRDGRVLISTSGSGVGNGQNVCCSTIPPRPPTASPRIAVAPPVSTPPTLPAPSNRAFLSARSQLLANRDGSTIVGVNLPAGANRVAFVYESVSATVLRSRTVTGTSSVLSISDDGTRFHVRADSVRNLHAHRARAAEHRQRDLSLRRQCNFNLQSNQGGSVFSPDGQTLYTAFDIAPVNGAPNVSQLMANDPDNLLIRTGFQLPENLSGKMVMSSDGANIFALSDSGLITLPISTIAQSPLAVPCLDRRPAHQRSMRRDRANRALEHHDKQSRSRPSHRRSDPVTGPRRRGRRG
jgi:DNA-binding beta-propeller fold protein YncE